MRGFPSDIIKERNKMANMQTENGLKRGEDMQHRSPWPGDQGTAASRDEASPYVGCALYFCASIVPM
ncbi:hypothetical protein AMECASPLE_008127 [Ameca splendens]|uniref:Uncharacterized protein n=1 Tax=Ameca splendens TaxID=208324 RepID=A0ABV0ZWU3_9TELE